ncbi:MAG: SIS domain-containing protein [Burkholderiaceae bacterium]|nr:SIS domain-containing protein [Microbacteriaceae bacterium]
MGSGEPLLQRLASEFGSLRKSERKVAVMVAENPEFFMHSTMAAVAEAAGVSEPTVMRFCTSLGFDGFQSFKINLAQTLALGIPATHSAINDDDSIPELTTKIFDHTLTSLDRARRNLDTRQIESAVAMLVTASNIIFIGFGASGIVAQDAAQKFPLFGVPCLAPIDAHQQFMAASSSTPGTVLVVISNTGRTKPLIEMARQAKRNGASVIAIAGGDAPLLSETDVNIVVKTFDDTDFYTPTVSRLAVLVVIDILATSVATGRGPEHLGRVRAMKHDLTSFRNGD